MIKVYDNSDLDINLLLNTNCNIKCPQCFAINHIDKICEEKNISMDDFVYVTELLKKDGLEHVNLIGGEPSLHPHVFDFIGLLKSKNIAIGFSTNAIWKPSFTKDMEKYSRALEFEITMHPKEFYDKGKLSKLYSALESLKGRKTSLGLVIYSPDFNYSFHSEMAEKFGFDIRWTLAEPAVGSQHKYMYYENKEELRKIGNKIYKFIRGCNDRGISTWLDLEVPACMFSKKQLEFFYNNKNHEIQFKCPQFFDIGPDLKIWKCFPLSELYTENLRNFEGLKEAYNHLKERFTGLEKQIIFDECLKCSFYVDNICGAGSKIAKYMKGADSNGYY